ncbi:MAG: gamma-glutamyltransferase [Polyangiaceae bacterium]|nr:gamma-glutamyltransferase [Polyangiaceae bacterium]
MRCLRLAERQLLCAFLAVNVAVASSCAAAPTARTSAKAGTIQAATDPVASVASASANTWLATPATTELPPNWPYRTPVVVQSMRGMVVTDNAISSKVGRDVLAAGGNAVDAAVATAFALAVAYPTAGNIGGGGFAIARMKGATHALDFREVAPAAVMRDTFVDASGKPTPDVREGIRSSAVPGSVAGLFELYDKFGSKKKTWRELLTPAIQLASAGFVVDDGFLETLKVSGQRLKKHAASASLFFPNGSPPSNGSLFQNPELATVLTRIANEGPKGFYEGPTANAIVNQMKAESGLITSLDLKNYKPKWRTPIEFTYRGHHIASMPPPSSGGVTLAMICHIVSGYDLHALGWQSPTSLHYMFEAMRRAFAARNAKLGDPDFVTMPLGELLSEAWATRQRATIAPDRATPSSEIESAGVPSGTGPHTTHLSVVDADGNAVAMTTTVNWWYGSGVTVKGVGFVLNNEMDDFASVPGQANGFGLVQGEANAIAPGKRMLSSMTPTIVTSPSGSIELVVGAAGGPTITTSVFQEISNVIDFGLDVGEAVSAPRFHIQHLPDVVAFEKDGIIDDVATRLTTMGYTLKERGHLADAPAIGQLGNVWIGAAEPRRIGSLAAAP